jgi:hypothetical protein
MILSSIRPANHHRVRDAGDGAGQPLNRLFERHRIAASLGDPAIPVRLRTVLGNLDTRTITLVAAAITTANG